MIIADFVAIGVAIIAVLTGASLGFGKLLKMITDGIIGVIISVIICYFISGIVLNIQFVSDLLLKFRTFLSAKNTTITKLLLKINIDTIVYEVALFILVQVVRAVIVSIIKDMFEADNVVMKPINKILGSLLFVALTVCIVLLVFQIIFWIKGTDSAVYGYLKGSVFKLDSVYENNPLNAFSEYFDKVQELVNDVIPQ